MESVEKIDLGLPSRTFGELQVAPVLLGNDCDSASDSASWIILFLSTASSRSRLSLMESATSIKHGPRGAGSTKSEPIGEVQDYAQEIEPGTHVLYDNRAIEKCKQMETLEKRSFLTSWHSPNSLGKRGLYFYFNLDGLRNSHIDRNHANVKNGVGS